jgi:hypothetical protein
MGHVSRISSWQRGLHAASTCASDDECSRGLLSIICSLSCATAYNTINAHTHVCILYFYVCTYTYLFVKHPAAVLSERSISARWQRWARVLCVFLKTWNIILFFKHKQHSSWCCSSGLLSIDGSLSCIWTLSFAGGLPKRFNRSREFSNINSNLGDIQARSNSQIRLISFLITFTIF